MITNIENYCIVVFKSYNETTLLYNKILEKGYKAQIISTPTSISKGCSQSLKLDVELVGVLRRESIKSEIQYDNIYKVVREDGERKYIEIDY